MDTTNGTKARLFRKRPILNFGRNITDSSKDASNKITRRAVAEYKNTAFTNEKLSNVPTTVVPQPAGVPNAVCARPVVGVIDLESIGNESSAVDPMSAKWPTVKGMGRSILVFIKNGTKTQSDGMSIDELREKLGFRFIF
ncbi:hypothetical protein M3Y96_00968500 [Aphelenchoides besseyi]|nr:hypothetical protein M3Y96_00968500 [Aphelenchoides besseyi]